MNRVMMKLIMIVALFPMVAMAITVSTGGSAPAAGSDPTTVHTGSAAPAAGSDPTTVHTGSAAPAAGSSSSTVPTGASAPAIGAPGTSTTAPTGASAPAVGGSGTATTVPTGASAPAVGGPGTSTTVPTGASAPAPGPTSSVTPGLTPGTTVVAAVAPAAATPTPAAATPAAVPTGVPAAVAAQVAAVAAQAAAAKAPPAPAAVPAAVPAAATPAKVAPELSKKVQAQAWQIIPAQSSIQFAGLLNEAPVTGQFKRFSGDINFDPANLEASHVKVIVEIGSISTSYRDIEDTLKTGDWLGMNLFPKAVFEASTFAYVREGQFRADGNLTIRDRTLPLSVMFTTSDVPPSNKKVLGTGVIKRTAFGVGRGEWAAVGEVGDDVTINFSLVAQKK